MRSGSRARVADALVLDASVAVKASLVADGFRVFHTELIAPSLLWSEAASGLRQLEWRRDISSQEAEQAMGRFLAAPIQQIPSAELVGEARALARELGWAKTYDAEYVVLARRLNKALITVDARLRRSVAHLVEIKGPTDIVTDALNDALTRLDDSRDPFVARAGERLLERTEE